MSIVYYIFRHISYQDAVVTLYEIFRQFNQLPEAATSSTFLLRRNAKCPSIEKIAKPAKKLVTQFPMTTIIVSLQLMDN